MRRISQFEVADNLPHFLKRLGAVVVWGDADGLPKLGLALFIRNDDREVRVPYGLEDNVQIRPRLHDNRVSRGNAVKEGIALDHLKRILFQSADHEDLGVDQKGENNDHRR